MRLRGFVRLLGGSCFARRLVSLPTSFLLLFAKNFGLAILCRTRVAVDLVVAVADLVELDVQCVRFQRGCAGQGKLVLNGAEPSQPTRQHDSKLHVAAIPLEYEARSDPLAGSILRTNDFMHAFDYEAPTTLPDALAKMAQHNGTARPLAGGTDLIDQMRVGRLAPAVLVDVKKIAELNVLKLDQQGLHLGAAVPCYRIYGDSIVSQQYSALADSSHIIGGVQIQSRASLGGNLCNSGPAADSTPSMIALGGICVIAGSSGKREVPVESFCTGPGKNVLKPGELLVEIRFPSAPKHSGSHYRRLIPRNEMDIAVVGVAAAVELDASGQKFVSARIALGAVAPTPLLATAAGEALAGQSVSDAAIAKAAQAARAIVTPITDMRGTKEYRVHVTGVLVERVVRAAVARARGEKLDYRPGQ